MKRTEVRAPLVAPPRWEVSGRKPVLLWGGLLILTMLACTTAPAQKQHDIKGISTTGPRYTEIAQSMSPTLDSAEPDRQLTEMESRMKKSLDNYRLPSEYRKNCDEHGQYDRAINFFCGRVAAQPDNWRVHLELSCAYVDKIPTCKGALAMVSQGALAGKALEQADRVVAANSNQWVSYYARGLNHLNWPRAFRHSEDAIKDLTQCVEIQERHGGQGGKPHYLKVHVALGDACTKAGKYQEAREAWQRGLKVFPDAKELRARLDTKDDKEQLTFVESQRSLERPVDTCLSFLDEEK